MKKLILILVSLAILIGCRGQIVRVEIIDDFIDIQYPKINKVELLSVEKNSCLISWTTDKNSDYFYFIVNVEYENGPTVSKEIQGTQKFTYIDNLKRNEKHIISIQVAGREDRKTIEVHTTDKPYNNFEVYNLDFIYIYPTSVRFKFETNNPILGKEVNYILKEGDTIVRKASFYDCDYYYKIDNLKPGCTYEISLFYTNSSVIFTDFFRTEI